MSAELERYLRKALEKLRETREKIELTRSYDEEVRGIRMLEEMVKEQLPNENSVYSTRPSR